MFGNVSPVLFAFIDASILSCENLLYVEGQSGLVFRFLLSLPWILLPMFFLFVFCYGLAHCNLATCSIPFADGIFVF